MFSMQIGPNERGTAAGGELVSRSALTLGSRTRGTVGQEANAPVQPG